MKTLRQTYNNKKMLLGVDTGGTFTDFVLYQQGTLKLHKVLSTPQAPELAILQGIRELGLDCSGPNFGVVHGTTVATNAALERKGVRTAFITNRGFGDMLTIGRQARKELYNLCPIPEPAPVAQELCVETGGRLDANGNQLEALTEKDIEDLIANISALQPKAVAICQLFSFLNNHHETRIQQAIEEVFGDSIFVTRSSLVLPEYKEYERGIATWYNAYLGPLVKDYLQRLQTGISPVPLAVMQSSGQTISADQAGNRAVNLLLSGPAGGLAAAEYIADLTDTNKLLSFDMGGTSTDVALIDGKVRLTSEGHIGDYPVAVPMVDMHTIGAGGGSIAYLDDGGMLHVGPESAGASPGPACYGQEGTHPTVTDANALLGRLSPDNFLGGRMKLRTDLSAAAIDPLAKKMNLGLAETALGIIDLANERIVQALRLISEQRGHDPKQYALCGFGGAGGLHICALAEALEMREAMVPIFGGVLSALGMLTAPPGREMTKAFLHPLNEVAPHTIHEAATSLLDSARIELRNEGRETAEPESLSVETTLDCRYQGQSFTLNIPWDSTSAPKSISAVEAHFHQLHKQTYGHKFSLPIEMVALRVSVRANAEPIKIEYANQNRIQASDQTKTDVWVREVSGGKIDCKKIRVPMIQRAAIPANQTLSGPLLICEEAATIWLASDWTLSKDVWGNLRLKQEYE